jgi:hypothetical protein
MGHFGAALGDASVRNDTEGRYSTKYASRDRSVGKSLIAAPFRDGREDRVAQAAALLTT